VTATRDVYLNVAGGLRVQEPAADLAVAAAIVSSELKLPAPSTAVFLGEVGLAGELRRVPAVAQRLGEAARLGFTTAIVPEHAGPGAAALPKIPGLQVIERGDLWSALRAVRLVGADTPHHSPELHETWRQSAADARASRPQRLH
jgi:DNA repair protein RadA/Sms